MNGKRTKDYKNRYDLKSTVFFYILVNRALFLNEAKACFCKILCISIKIVSVLESI